MVFSSSHVAQLASAIPAQDRGSQQLQCCLTIERSDANCGRVGIGALEKCRSGFIPRSCWDEVRKAAAASRLEVSAVRSE